MALACLVLRGITALIAAEEKPRDYALSHHWEWEYGSSSWATTRTEVFVSICCLLPFAMYVVYAAT
jgi:hypothetical protein